MTPSSERQLPGYRPGYHVCHPFDDNPDRDASLIPFLTEGLLRGERCIYAARPAALRDAEEGLREAGVDVSRARSRRALVLLPSEEAYGDEGRFNEEQTLAFVGSMLDQCLAEGFIGLRGAGELGHAPTAKEMTLLRSYELRVNEIFGDRPFTALCSYPRQLVHDSFALELLHAHPQAWAGGQLCENPFYDTVSAAAPSGPRPGRRPLPETLQLIDAHQQTLTRGRRMLDALAVEAARAQVVAKEADDDREREDDALVDGMRRHLRPLRAELRHLRQSLRDDCTPPPAEVLDHLERIWIEARELAEVAAGIERRRHGDREADREAEREVERRRGPAENQSSPMGRPERDRP